jgi:ssDNA-binding Zn-finger/Zn-ribbon topoisomerase 1
LPGEELPAIAGAGDPCPECGATDGGVLVTRRGRFGPFAGCSRYPDCKYILKTGPEPPSPLPFTVTCPQCGEGHLATRRARRTGSLFWGCSRYPTCDFTTSREPVGAVHDADDGPIAKAADGGAICLRCGASVTLPADEPVVGQRLPGGPANAAALLRPARRGRPAAVGRSPGPRRAAGSGKARATTTRRTKRARSTPGA